MAVLITGLSIASIVTSSITLKSTQKKYRTIAAVTLAISIAMIILVAVCLSVATADANF